MSLKMRSSDIGPPLPAERTPGDALAPAADEGAARWPADLGGTLADAWRVSQLLRHPIRHVRLGWLLARAPMRGFAVSKTKLRLKYLVDYASKNLTTGQRYQVVSTHYAFLQQRFQTRFMHAVSTGAIRLWKQPQAWPAGPLTIMLDFPATMQTEGDLCLTLKSGRRAVYRLIFSIAAGATFGVDGANVLLVTCVQGLQSSTELRGVAAACHDVHPSDLLMAALGGFAGASAIGTLIGICTDHQIANKGRIFFSYDDFFAKYGAYRAAVKAYEIALPFSQKPLSDIAAKYRGRTRAKRVLRQAVGAAAQTALVPYLCP
jgi:uncharacterized protein VirK/YbjX